MSGRALPCPAEGAGVPQKAGQPGERLGKREVPRACGGLPFSDLHPFPHRPTGHVGDLNALGLQVVPDAVGLGEVLRLFGVRTLQYQRVDGRVALALDGEAVILGIGHIGIHYLHKKEIKES